MCGIAGIVKINKPGNPVTFPQLEAMSRVIVYRGPDADGHWISRKRTCGFAFRRLSIVDLSPAGNQPMSTPDGKYTIVFNGEIYNHLIIKKELIERGVQYNSRSDTETILHGYGAYGTGILDKMLGMWGLAIWDEEKKELFASRDRIGIKPFYYYYENGNFVFGSEIKAILTSPEVSKELNYEEIPNYLNFGTTSNTNSLFRNIHKLPAGHYLNLKSDGTLIIKRYWSPYSTDDSVLKMDEKEIGTETLRLLKQSIKDRMMSDVPFGVFLSGGVDSSLNVALMAELMDRPIDTYTVGYKDLEKYNELQYARQVSNLFQTNHREILVDKEDAFPVLEELAWHEDEPNGDPVCIPLYFLSKLTRDSGTIVVQVGEGSDEEFVGYTSMLRDYNFYRSVWKDYNSLPSLIKKMAYNAASPLFYLFRQYEALEFLRRSSYGQQLYWAGNSILSPVYMKKLLNGSGNSLINQPAKYIDRLYQQSDSINPDADYLQKCLFMDVTHRLPELLLMRVDKVSMAHSIECRVPFLDHRIVEFAMKIPSDKKVPDKRVTKHLLKQAVRGILPDEIINRKKQGFWAPVDEWLRHDWYQFTKSSILNNKLTGSNLFNKQFVTGMLENHRSGKRNEGKRLFALLTLALWHDKYFGKL